MNNVWKMNNISEFLEIYEEAIKLGKERGKKAGDNIEEEFFEIANQKKAQMQYLGTTDQDKDLIVGNLREEGIKVLNLDEERRRKEVKND